jgi:hypothetical protein
MADRDDEGATRHAAHARQLQHDEKGQRARSERQEGARGNADATPSGEVPQAGMNPELGDMDAEADPDRDPKGGSDGLPGKMGGGLLGG